MEIPQLESSYGSINEGKELDSKNSWVICIYDAGNDSCGFIVIPEKECLPYKAILDKGVINLIVDETTEEDINLAKLIKKHGIKYGPCNIKCPARFYGISILE